MEQFTTSIYNTTTPVGVDAGLSKVQQKLANIPWLHTCFGKADTRADLLTPNENQNRFNVTGRNTRSNRLVYYPVANGEGGAEEMVMPSDKYPSYIFFNTKDKGRPGYANMANDWTDPQTLINQWVSLILFVDMSKLQPGTPPYDFDQGLQYDVLKALKQCPNVEIRDTYDNYLNVFDGFTMTETYRNYSNTPYYGLRIDFIITYPLIADNVVGGIFPVPDITPPFELVTVGEDGYEMNEDGTSLTGDYFNRPIAYCITGAERYDIETDFTQDGDTITFTNGVVLYEGQEILFYKGEAWFKFITVGVNGYDISSDGLTITGPYLTNIISYIKVGEQYYFYGKDFTQTGSSITFINGVVLYLMQQIFLYKK